VRVGRRSVTLLAAATLVSALALGAVAAGAQNATVTIKDTGISPARVSIEAGGKVTWTDAGKKPHAVASLDSAFQPFVLLSGSSRTLTFRKPDCYAYTVDGRFDGTVRVGGASCGGGSSGPPPGGKPKIVRYDVFIEGHAERTETAANEPDPDADGKRVVATDWTMSWKGLRYSVKDFGSSVIVLPVRLADVKKGVLKVQSAFSETRNKRLFGDNCKGKVFYPQYKASIFVNTTIKPVLWTLQAGTAVGSQLADYNKITLAKQKLYCNGNIVGYADWDSPVQKQVQGATLDLTFLSELLSVHAERRGGVGRPFPIVNMVAGRSLSISTRTFELLKTGVCGAPAVCTQKLRTSVKITFTARR
jgi:plastocyanin